MSSSTNACAHWKRRFFFLTAAGELHYCRSEADVDSPTSMGSLLLCAGDKGRRLALPHSRTMIHQPMGGAQGQASDIKIEAERILIIRERVAEIYATLCGQPKDKVITDLDRDKFLSAYECVEYGLIDTVLEKPLS